MQSWALLLVQVLQCGVQNSHSRLLDWKVFAGHGGAWQLLWALRYRKGVLQLRQALDPNLSQLLQLGKQSLHVVGVDSKVPSSQVVTHLLSGVSLNPVLQPRQSKFVRPVHSAHELWHGSQDETPFKSTGTVPLGHGG